MTKWDMTSQYSAHFHRGYYARARAVGICVLGRVLKCSAMIIQEEWCHHKNPHNVYKSNTPVCCILFFFSEIELPLKGSLTYCVCPCYIASRNIISLLVEPLEIYFGEFMEKTFPPHPLTREMCCCTFIWAKLLSICANHSCVSRLPARQAAV